MLLGYRHATFALQFLVVCAGLAAAPRALAQEPPQRYIDLRSQAQELDDAGQYAEARRYILRAHAIFPNAGSLFVMGGIEFHMEQWPQAAQHLEEARTSTVRPLNAARIAELQEMLNTAIAHCGVYSLAALPPNAQIIVDDGAPTLDSAGALMVAEGTHQISLSAPGYESVARSLRVRGGDTGALPITLSPVPTRETSTAVAPPTPEEHASTTTTPPTHDATPVHSSTVREAPPAPSADEGYVPWFGVGLATLALGAGGLIGGAIEFNQGEVQTTTYNDSTCGATPDVAQCADARAQRDEFYSRSTGLFVAGGILAGVSLVFFVLEAAQPTRHSATSASVSCTPGLLALSCRGSF